MAQLTFKAQKYLTFNWNSPWLQWWNIIWSTSGQCIICSEPFHPRRQPGL